MIDLSAALARAFDKHLEIRGNSGYRGNQTAELSEFVIPDHEALVATANRPMATVATGTPARRRAAPPVATIATDRKVVATGAAARRMAEGRALGRPVSTVATVATGPEHEAHDFADGVPTPDTEFATALWGPVARRNAVPSSGLAGTQTLPTSWRLEHRRTPRLAQRQPHRRRLDHRGNRGTPMAPRATTTGQIGADAVTKAMTNASARSAEGRVPPVQVRLQRVNASISRVYPPDGQNEVWWQRLKAALGSCSSAFVNAALIQLQQAARLPTSSISETAVNAALAMIEAAAPRNEIEGALAIQMACCHASAMAVLARLAGAVGPERRVASLATAAARLMRAYTAQVEALRRLRHGGDQNIRVEHVHVHEGGQAVVGTIQSG